MGTVLSSPTQTKDEKWANAKDQREKSHPPGNEGTSQQILELLVSFEIKIRATESQFL
jgi:hypothetical protein